MKWGNKPLGTCLGNWGQRWGETGLRTHSIIMVEVGLEHIFPDSKADVFISVLHLDKITRKKSLWNNFFVSGRQLDPGVGDTQTWVTVSSLLLRGWMSECLCLTGIFCIGKLAVTCMNGTIWCGNPVASGTTQLSTGWPLCLRGCVPGQLQHRVTCSCSLHPQPLPQQNGCFLYSPGLCIGREGLSWLALKGPKSGGLCGGKVSIIHRVVGWCSEVFRFRYRVRALMNWNPHPHGSLVTSDRRRSCCLCWKPAPCVLSIVLLALLAFTSQLPLLTWGYLYCVFWPKIFLQKK